MLIIAEHLADNDRRKGFSLLELVIVLVLVLVIGSIAIPNMVTVVSNARLRGGATNLSGLFQNARMLAVKENRTMTTHFTVLGNGPTAYVKQATDTSDLATADPQVQMGAPLTKVTSPTGTGAPAAITSTQLGFTAATGSPSFNSRGLPCEYASGVCTNKGFIYYFYDQRPFSTRGWAAVSISPAGRIKRWFWNGSAWGD